MSTQILSFQKKKKQFRLKKASLNVIKLHIICEIVYFLKFVLKICLKTFILSDPSRYLI